MAVEPKEIPFLEGPEFSPEPVYQDANIMVYATSIDPCLDEQRVEAASLKRKRTPSPDFPSKKLASSGKNLSRDGEEGSGEGSTRTARMDKSKRAYDPDFLKEIIRGNFMGLENTAVASDKSTKPDTDGPSMKLSHPGQSSLEKGKKKNKGKDKPPGHQMPPLHPQV